MGFEINSQQLKSGIAQKHFLSYNFTTATCLSKWNINYFLTTTKVDGREHNLKILRNCLF